ncbi:diguanylate cyclase domain-containing protein [Bosea sp. NPDC055353]
MDSQQLIAATRPLYERSLAPAALGAWECNLANETLSWTDGVYDLFSLQRGSEIYRKATLDLYEEGSRREMEQHRSNAIRTGQGFALDCRIRAVNGDKRWMRLIVGVGYQHGRPSRIFGSKQDVTAEKGLWNSVSCLTRAESPTSPAARRSFTDILRQVRQDRGRAPECLALAIFEIDRFPTIVENHGRAAGDDVIRCFGERLRRLFPDALAIDQTGPAAFALLLRMPGDKAYLAAMLTGTRKLLCRPIPRGYLVIDFTASIGAALLKTEGCCEQNEIFAEAEAALHVAGLAGGDCIRVFDGPVTAVSRTALSG